MLPALAVPGSLECGQNARGKDGHLNGPPNRNTWTYQKLDFFFSELWDWKCFSAEVRIPGGAEKQQCLSSPRAASLPQGPLPLSSSLSLLPPSHGFHCLVAIRDCLFQVN